MSKESIKLSLLDNSHAYFAESVDKALQSTNDVRHWQFAILHLVQSLELSIKALLKEIHEAFIYENIDNPKNTVSISLAIKRLENTNIGNTKLSDKDKRRIKQAINLRNQITHSEYELTSHHAEAKYFELFGFVVHFQQFHLNVEIEDIIDSDLIEQLLNIEKSRKELISKAHHRIEENEIEEDNILECPNCLAHTLVIEDGIDTCYTCRNKAMLVECPHCKSFCFDWEIESFAEEIDYQYEEGQVIIYNDYGYSYTNACQNCIAEIKEDIEEKRMHEQCEWEMEAYYQTKA